MKLVFLSGLGDSTTAWDEVISFLPSEWRTSTMTLAKLCPLESFTLDRAVTGLAKHVRSQDEQTHLVGLSAGAMVALQYAATHKIGSLFLSSPQISPPRAVLAIQNTIFRFLPGRAFQSAGLTKSEAIAVTRGLAHVDLTADARQISVHTTVACGSKDRANLKAAELAHSLIPNSHLRVIEGAGHEWHKTMPLRFAQGLERHFRQIM